MFSRTPVVLRALTAVAALAALTACGSSSSTGADGRYAGPPSSSPTPTHSSQPSSDTTSAAPSESATAASGPCTYAPDPSGQAAKQVKAPPAKPTVSGKVAVDIKTTIGDLHATLDADKTPCTVNSFVSLAKQKYFDSTPCHRLVTQGIYVLQCGDPTGTGTGGPGYTVPDELSGQETYQAGTLAMANTGQPNSGGSQFFIVFKDSPLPPSYAVFGQVDAAAVKAITAAAKKGVAGGGTDGPPKEKVDISSVSVG